MAPEKSIERAVDFNYSGYMNSKESFGDHLSRSKQSGCIVAQKQALLKYKSKLRTYIPCNLQNFYFSCWKEKG